MCRHKANLNKFTFSAFLQFPESLQIKPVGVTNKAQREKKLHVTVATYDKTLHNESTMKT